MEKERSFKEGRTDKWTFVRKNRETKILFTILQDIHLFGGAAHKGKVEERKKKISKKESGESGESVYRRAERERKEKRDDRS